MPSPFAFTRTAALLLSLLAVPAGVGHAQRAASSTKAAAAAQAAPTPGASGRVSINSASEKELVALPGIGPARAKAIIELRTKLGGFKKLEDLMRVKGIGRATFRKLEPMMRL